jgi:hypothetical protein
MSKQILLYISIGTFIILALTSMYKVVTGIDDIKSDIALIKQGSVYEIKNLQYQLDELKDCCKDKQRHNQIVFNNREAILPHNIEENE